MSTKDFPKAEFVTIDKEMAHEFLKRNIRNRTVSEKTVQRYSEIMKRGEWAVNGEAIQISDGGVLLNGQHRLEAIYRSGIPQTMLVCTGISDESMATFDRGKARTMGDVLSIEQIPQSKYIAAIIKSYLMLHEGMCLNMSSDGTMSNPNTKSLKLFDEDFINAYRRNEMLYQDALKDALAMQKRLRGLFTVSELASYIVYLVLDVKHEYSKCVRFFNAVHDLKDMDIPSASLLRDRLIHNKLSNTKITSQMKRGLIVKAWNEYIQPKDIKRLVFNEKEVLKFI